MYVVCVRVHVTINCTQLSVLTASSVNGVNFFAQLPMLIAFTVHCAQFVYVQTYRDFFVFSFGLKFSELKFTVN